MAETVNEGWPLIAASQAQKHITHNEALEAADARINTWHRVNWTFPTIGSTGILTITSSAVVPAVFSGTTDSITSIQGGSDGTILTMAGTTSRTITVVNGGNIKLGIGNVILNGYNDTLTLIKRGDNWFGVSFFDSAAAPPPTTPSGGGSV